MATPIANKLQQLRNVGFNIGITITGEQDSGYGGKMQQFANATIYYHAVMGSAAHEVHGGIRTKYLAMGGHHINPATGNRSLGFPLTDEKNADDARCRVSRFEWGALYWINGGVAVYGQIYTQYLQAGSEQGRLGYPIADPVPVIGGMASFFEHGILYYGEKSKGQILEIAYLWPSLGRPWLVPTSTLPANDVIKFNFFRSFTNTNIAGHLFEELFNGRIFLKQTAGTKEIPLAFDFTKVRERQFLATISTYSSPVSLKSSLENRQLYDLILKLPGRVHSIAPHAVYCRESWHDFNIIHVTDTHISRRLDTFRKFFRDRGMTDAVNNFNNFNDNFREFIRYANILHRAGKLDMIMLTGDLVDYVFEDGGKGYYQNNFAHFENIVKGLTGKPDMVQEEELIVPMLTSLGNHDYRTTPYYPLFTVDLQWPVSNRTMEQYSSMNLTKNEAEIVTKDLLGIKSMISADRAIGMIRPDRENHGGNLNHYFRNINRDASYTLQLGDHQLVMIDGKWDDGTIEGTWDAISYYLGFKGEASDNFTGGSPDSVGFNGEEMNMVSRALQKQGLVIIGVHDPIINPKYSNYPWFLREYIRTANPVAYSEEMKRYLFGMQPEAFVTSSTQNACIIDLSRNSHPGWSRTNSFWFHEGNGGDLLDYAVMRGSQENFLKMITGIQNSPRAADLVLSGHVHKNWECRVIRDTASGKMRFSHEFFTENPVSYYLSTDVDVNTKSRFTIQVPFTMAAAVLKNLVKGKQRKIHPEITNTAANNEQPVKRSSGEWWVKTKPYPYTLSAQKNTAQAKQWWLNLRPLLVQTAALGPSEWLRSPERHPDFRGCRLIEVQSDVILKISYITHDRIKEELSKKLTNIFDHVRPAVFHKLG